MHPFVICVPSMAIPVSASAHFLILLVIQPIVSGFGNVGSLFDALFVFVMLMLVLALAQDKVWRVIACILWIPAATLSIGGHFLTSSAQVVSVTAGHAIGALFFVAVAGKIIQSIFVSREAHLGQYLWRDLRIPVAGRRMRPDVCDDLRGKSGIISIWRFCKAADGTGGLQP